MNIKSFVVFAISGLIISSGVNFCYGSEMLDGVWTLHSKVLIGPNKGNTTENTLQITQDQTGRIDGKTVGENDSQQGRVSGLVMRTTIEMTYSYQKDVYRCTLQLGEDANLMAGVFRRTDGSSGVIYGLKKEPEKKKKRN